MHGLEAHPTLRAVVRDDLGREYCFLVKVIVPTEGKAYALFDDLGKPTALTFEQKANNSVSFVSFNGLWIENDEVTSLDILLKSKLIYIGQLISLA
ncbi:hypothetical protein APS14_03115 [Pseudomonas thivervalensis]|uniref:hypothetical protein n=1 Tax=Pseudomonas thivervalensis TaxID=86265 RepID=UPI00069EC84B|nr:hypothetical protein [Pseudomonas thivervalensis]OAB52899.1 hypothetical protein APS14_03115 [Pseudomonas thivervalensis]SDG15847.1 hypothetical protein SAMN04490204_3237 [Pseudomonas thivervalensis]